MPVTTTASTASPWHYCGAAGATELVKSPVLLVGAVVMRPTALIVQIPKAKLKELVKKHRPPTWWYGQKEEDLF
jgi:hypothetical protein